MLNKQGFNLWASDYDQTVQISEENQQYPFAGYKEIMNLIFNEVMQKKHSRVLDIGFGTGVLASKLYENGHRIDGVDFSSQMIEIAQSKMPNANLIEWDISNGLPDAIIKNQYDFIVSTYALHHLEDQDKAVLIEKLLLLLTEQGKIIIGDIAFQKQEDLQSCRTKSIDFWDEDEFYFVFQDIKELLKTVCNCEFHQVSHCGGILVLTK